MARIEDALKKWVIGAAFQPNRYWWESGNASLYLTTGLWNQAKDFLPPDVLGHLTIQSEHRAVTTFEGLFYLLEALQKNPPAEVGLEPDLQLLGRFQRLALEIVREQDIFPFTALTTLEAEKFVPELIRVTESTEDEWVQSGGVAQHAAMWIPAFRDAYVQSLRKVYLSLADVYFQSHWNAKAHWPATRHGQMISDLWICHCVDFFARTFAKKPAQLEPEVSSRSGARVPYRGEQELLSNWRYHLTNRFREPFAADRWLVWRMVKQIFADSGWQTENIINRTGALQYHLEMELVPPLDDSPASDWKLVWYIAHNLWNRRIPLSKWWRQRDRQLQVGLELLLEPDKWFLPKLRQAAEISDAIARSMRQPNPYEAILAADELIPFLYEELPQLSRMGISVKSPEIDSMETRDVRIRVQVKRAKAKSHKQSQRIQVAEGWFDTKKLVDFDWAVVVGDSEISREQFQTMVKEQSPYIQLNGTWRLVPVQEILKQIQSLETLAHEKAETNLLQFSRIVSLGEENPIQVDVQYGSDVAEAEHWLDDLKRAPNPPILAAPRGFHGVLRNYQQQGFSWLVHLRKLGLGGCLADDMGLGKTIQVLAYFMYLKEQNLSQGPHLLICPTSLLQNWKSEIHRFTPELKAYIHHGSNRNTLLPDGESPLKAAMEQVDVVMTTYATLVRDIEWISQLKWNAVVADEAQNIKNTDTKQAGAIRQIATFHPIALTGTPVENRLEELWSIMDFLNPGYLGNLNWFRREFANKIQQEPNGLAAKRIQLLLQPVLLRRRKTDEFIQVELPEKWEVREYAGLTAEQAALYQSILDRLWPEITVASQISRRGQILAALVRLKQVCDHPCLVTGGNNSTTRSAKLKMLLDLVEDVTDEEDGALIFTQFRDMGDLICDALEARFGWRPNFLHGGLSASARGEIVKNFQERIDPSPVLVLSLKAGGVGLNLTRANHVFHFDRWWNPAVEDQATDRAFRIGQTKDVQVHKLVCSGTLEERIDELITAKRTLSAAIVGESETWLTEMNDDELKSLFILDKAMAMSMEADD